MVSKWSGYDDARSGQGGDGRTFVSTGRDLLLYPGDVRDALEPDDLHEDLPVALVVALEREHLLNRSADQLAELLASLAATAEQGTGSARDQSR